MIPLKKAIVVSSLTVLSILLVGCGNNSKTDTNSTNSTNTSVSVEKSDNSTSDSGFPVEIEDSSN